MFFYSVAGIWLISLVNFYIGRKFLAKKFNDACKIGTRDRVCTLFQKYGKIEILVAALTPVPFVSSCWAAGAFKMRLRDFFFFGMLVRALRIGFFANIIYYLIGIF